MVINFVKTQLVSVMLLLPSLKTAPPISAVFPSNLLPVTVTLLQFILVLLQLVHTQSAEWFVLAISETVTVQLAHDSSHNCWK